jgi:hypothetical protein
MAGKNNKKSKYFDRNPIEAALRDTMDGVIDSVKTGAADESKETINTLWKQLLGESGKSQEQQAQMSGDLAEGEELDLSKKQQKMAEKLANIEAGYDYKTEILHFERRESQESQNQTSTKIQEILIEIKQLSNSVKELEVEVKDVAMDTVPAKAGKYHESFFEYLLTMLRNARIRVESSGSWLQAVVGKKAKKGFWENAKKHGTSYSMSADRAVSQQVG